ADTLVETLVEAKIRVPQQLRGKSHTQFVRFLLCAVGKADADGSPGERALCPARFDGSSFLAMRLVAVRIERLVGEPPIRRSAQRKARFEVVVLVEKRLQGGERYALGARIDDGCRCKSYRRKPWRFWYRRINVERACKVRIFGLQYKLS